MSKAYNTKKYFILICEGETDKTALNLVSNRYFKSLSKDVNVTFKVFKGDFLYIHLVIKKNLQILMRL